MDALEYHPVILAARNIPPILPPETPRGIAHPCTGPTPVPKGPDGRESELIAGKPFTAKHTVVAN
jgi:hypothetical protein